MPIPVTCDCGRSLKVKDEYAGKRARCPACQKVLLIPTPEKKAEEEAVDFLLAEPVEEKPRQVNIQRERPRADADEEEPRVPWRRREPREEVELPRRRPILRDEPETRQRERAIRPREERSSGWRIQVSPGVMGGALAMLIAVVWFFGGLAVGIIFFYPPILFILGLIGFFRSLAGHEED